MNAPDLPRILHRTDDLRFTHSFAELPPAFYTRLMPTPFK